MIICIDYSYLRENITYSCWCSPMFISCTFSWKKMKALWYWGRRSIHYSGLALRLGWLGQMVLCGCTFPRPRLMNFFFSWEWRWSNTPSLILLETLPLGRPFLVPSPLLMLAFPLLTVVMVVLFDWLTEAWSYNLESCLLKLWKLVLPYVQLPQQFTLSPLP